MTLVRWEPRHAFGLRREFDSLIDSFWGGWGDRNGTPGAWHPRVDVSETEDAYVVHADLPGMGREDISVTFKEHVLRIEGEKVRTSDEKDKGSYRSERAFGRFSRAFTLPATVNADKISASYKEGVLSLTIPKAEVAKPKQIEVKVA